MERVDLTLRLIDSPLESTAAKTKDAWITFGF